ncbi:MAG: hypothetical protein QOI24_2289 [Acidobacteriota bacterium]|nr:hypothetical protein [Acidobacteriota bacterium]
MRRAACMLMVWLVAVIALGETGKPRTDVNLRTAPNTRRSRVIAVLSTADTFEILETRRTWCRVRVAGSSAEGWLAKKYVEMIPAAPPAPAPVATEGGGTLATLLVLLLIGALLGGVGYSAGQQPDSATSKRWAVFIASFALGTFYIGFTLPKGLATLGAERQWLAVQRLGEWSLAFNQRLAGAIPDFSTLMRYVAWAVVIYLVSLLILGVHHGQLNLFGWGAATLAFSVAILHVLIWVSFIVAKIVMFVLWVFGGIARFFGAVLTWILQAIFAIFVWIYELLANWLGAFWWIVPVAGVVVMLALMLRSRTSPKDLLALIGRVLLAGAAASGVLFALIRAWRWIEPILVALATFLRAVVLFIVALIAKLLLGALLIVAVATVGQLLLDQINGALSAGRRRYGVIIGAVAIGSSIAVLLFISNLYGVTGWLPSQVTEFATHYLHQPAPLLDAVIALAVVALSVVGVWRNMPAMGQEPTLAEFGKSMVYVIAGICVTGALGAIAGQTES